MKTCQIVRRLTAYSTTVAVLLTAPLAFAVTDSRIFTRGADGHPFVAGTSSYGWSGWQYSDNIVVNKTNMTGTWTVPALFSRADVLMMLTVTAYGDAFSTAQLVLDDATGNRVYYSSATGMGPGYAQFYGITLPSSYLTSAYVNYVIVGGTSTYSVGGVLTVCYH